MRHGRTDWNDKKKLQGRTDIPLNETGIKMAEKAAVEYKDVHFDVCFCSPLVRAKATAQIVLKGRNVPIIPDDHLIEMGFGVYEGIENSVQIKNSPINDFFFHPEHYKTVENGESFEELFARTGEFLKKTVKPLLDAGKDVLIVGHGAMNCSIICQVKNLPLKDFWSAGIENCKLMKL